VTGRRQTAWATIRLDSFLFLSLQQVHTCYGYQLRRYVTCWGTWTVDSESQVCAVDGIPAVAAQFVPQWHGRLRDEAVVPNLSHFAMTLPNARIKRRIMYCFVLLGTWTDIIVKGVWLLTYLAHVSEAFSSHFHVSLRGDRRVLFRYVAVNIRFLLNKCKEDGGNYNSGYWVWRVK